jgi:hypothetical protein
MQYTSTINHRALIEINQDTESKLDLLDATIIDFFSRFVHTKNVKFEVIDGKVFYWVAYQKVMDELPLLMINNKEIIARRFKKICKANVLEFFQNKKKGNLTYFCFGENYQKIISFGIDSKVETLSTQKSEAIDSKVETLSTQKSNNQVINNQVIISGNNNNIKKEKKFDAEIYVKNIAELNSEVKQTLLDLIEIRKCKKAATTAKSIDLIIKDLNKWYPDNPKKQIEALENSVRGGWIGVFEIKDNPGFISKNSNYSQQKPAYKYSHTIKKGEYTFDNPRGFNN